ncbi:hypothetical protein P3S68_007257 [Capsicum galapagoense]
MGLNESFSHVRSDILLRTPILIVNQAYAVVIQEESQRNFGVTDSHKESVSLMVRRGQGPRAGPKRFGYCDHCGCKGHVKEL